MKRTKLILKIIATLCAFFFLLSCDYEVGSGNESGVVLIVTRIIGADFEGNDADYLVSDVADDDPAPPNLVVADPVLVTLEAKLKKPETIIPGVSYKTSVMIDRYTITFTSPQGDPVPAGFEGRLSAVCEVDASVEIEILAVRPDDKFAPPLSTLGGGYIWAVAEITIIGHDLQGYPVEAVCYLTVYFANWVDR